MQRIDAHAHISADHPDSLQRLEEQDLRVLNISVAKDFGQSWRELGDLYRDLARRHPERTAWCTSFDPYDPDRSGYADQVIETLTADIAAGAIACKIWKNVGMEIRRKDGRHILPDDRAYEPVYRFLSDNRIPLLMHIGEPLACWQSPDTPSPHQNYYRNFPQWSMYGRKDVPSHAQLIAARDNVVERFPELHIIGAHLGSLETDLSQLAERFRRYPNFAVDTSARTADLCRHDPVLVREWFDEFQDRILWGTDVVQRTSHSTLPDEERRLMLDNYVNNCQANLAFYRDAGPVTYGPYQVTGLDLPETTLLKFFRDNALAWYPGLRRGAADSDT